MSRPAVFLDRDGVINRDHAYVYKIEDFIYIDGVLEAARRLHEAGYLLVVITNQSGIGRGYFTEDDFQKLTESMKATFANAGAPIAGVYFCPHHPKTAIPQYLCDCNCRKPKPGMILQAAADLDIDLGKSILLGDSPRDLEAAHAAGVPMRILLGKDGLTTPQPIAVSTAVAASLAEAARTIILL